MSASVQRRTTFETLPWELRTRIAEHLRHDHNNSKDSKIQAMQDVASLTLVSRACLSSARFVLYRYPYISSMRVDQWTIVERQLKSNSYFFVRTLLENPSLFEKMRDLEIEIKLNEVCVRLEHKVLQDLRGEKPSGLKCECQGIEIRKIRRSGFCHWHEFKETHLAALIFAVIPPIRTLSLWLFRTDYCLIVADMIEFFSDIQFDRKRTSGETMVWRGAEVPSFQKLEVVSMHGIDISHAFMDIPSLRTVNADGKALVLGTRGPYFSCPEKSANENVDSLKLCAPLRWFCCPRSCQADDIESHGMERFLRQYPNIRSLDITMRGYLGGECFRCGSERCRRTTNFSYLVSKMQFFSSTLKSLTINTDYKNEWEKADEWNWEASEAATLEDFTHLESLTVPQGFFFDPGSSTFSREIFSWEDFPFYKLIPRNLRYLEITHARTFIDGWLPQLIFYFLGVPGSSKEIVVRCCKGTVDYNSWSEFVSAALHAGVKISMIDYED